MTDFHVAPLDASFGAVVTGLTLADLDDAAFSRLYATWLEYALLVFPDQHLSNEQQVEFAIRFGELEFDLVVISNVKKDGSVRVEDDADGVIQVLKGNMGWHCDSTYMPVQAKGAVFTAHVVPSSRGETGWADLRAGYDALDAVTKEKVATLSAYHSLRYSQKKSGFTPKAAGAYKGYGLDVQDPPLRPLVKTHPETGRKSLLIGRHAYGIPGMDPAESEAFLKSLVDHTCQPPRVYHHSWKVGDAVVWDNRRLLHQSCPWDMTQARVMYHARIAGDPASEFAGPS
ncbi:MAG: TauD/TfdA family dioxygenase [Desulfurellaceae bacterium]|nr:TauD/TfdA family dioxygenase [Desulfurellaceae bacterium]